MSRIKLRSLLNLTEQAPQPPMPGLGGSMPQREPPAGMNAGQPEAPAPEAPPTPDASPEPEDPGEYDFTKDFRAFEDKKNKAEADAKKVLMDKMNKRLLGKTIVANASRGYGQPKTDYTIKGVKKISVEFWYKDYVVIAADENDKKYFLTPGINIKIESSEPAPGSEQPADAGQAPAGDGEAGQGAAEQPPTGQESPNSQPAEPEPQGVQPAAEPVVPPQQEVPEKPAVPPQANPNAAPIDPKKKKKLPLQKPVAENDESGVRMKNIGPDVAQRDLGKFFSEWLNQRYDITRFVRSAKASGKDESGMYHTEYILEIPKEVFGNTFDSRDFALEFRNAEYSSGGPGQAFSRGSVNVTSNGRFYTFKFSLSGGMDI